MATSLPNFLSTGRLPTCGELAVDEWMRHARRPTVVFGFERVEEVEEVDVLPADQARMNRPKQIAPRLIAVIFFDIGAAGAAELGAERRLSDQQAQAMDKRLRRGRGDRAFLQEAATPGK